MGCVVVAGEKKKRRKLRRADSNVRARAEVRGTIYGVLSRHGLASGRSLRRVLCAGQSEECESNIEAAIVV